MLNIVYTISYLDLFWVINNGRRSYSKRTKMRNKSPDSLQISLFTKGVCFLKHTFLSIFDYA